MNQQIHLLCVVPERTMLKERCEKYAKEVETLTSQLYAQFSVAFNSLKARVGTIAGDYIACCSYLVSIKIQIMLQETQCHLTRQMTIMKLLTLQQKRMHASQNRMKVMAQKRMLIRRMKLLIPESEPELPKSDLYWVSNVSAV